MTIRIKSGLPVYGGYTLARDEKGEIIFIKGALPEETVDIKIEETKKNFSIARVIDVVEPSPQRVNPVCEVYGACGGCQLQHVDYNYQLELKSWVLKDTLKRIAKLDENYIPVKYLRPFNYRYRAQFKVSAKGIGFYKEASRELVPVNSCVLMVDKINSLLQGLSGLCSFKSLKELHVSTNGFDSILYLRGLYHSEGAIRVINDNTLIGIVFEDGVYGAEYINLSIDNLFYTISAKSFFQTNWELNRELIKRILELIQDNSLRILDLYSGAGNFSIPVALKVKEVTAVEENPYAFNDLRRNIELNGIKNIRPVNSSIERFRPSGRYDIVIVDPPRPGMSNKALKTILELAPQEIFYISCNPPTLARDIRKLSGLYEVISIEIFDFFPSTYHLETFTILKKRS